MLKKKIKLATYMELNVDGLIGPTHHYAGLSFGNHASMQHAYEVSYPKKAAMQGLKKMRLLYELGLPQAILPPPLRPNFALLKSLGFTGNKKDLLQQAFLHAPRALSACYSASSMWAANAATVSAAFDTKDQKTHFTPANLVSSLHRSQETAFTAKVLRRIFWNKDFFTHHPPLPATMHLSDEGAANINRLCTNHSAKGVMVFVYGQTALDKTLPIPNKYPARQTKEASQAIARTHQLDAHLTLFAQQNPAVIDQGVFHNDVISLANENIFLVHAEAFLDQENLLATIKNTVTFDLNIIQISNQQLSVKEAVQCYFFNSQLVTLPNKTMCLIAPLECKYEKKAFEIINQLINNKQNPIEKVFFIDLKQSMHNGGGPACLRLRVPLSQEALSSMHQGVIINSHLLEQLENWVDTHYRDTLTFEDFINPTLYLEIKKAFVELETIIKMPR